MRSQRRCRANETTAVANPAATAIPSEASNTRPTRIATALPPITLLTVATIAETVK